MRTSSIILLTMLLCTGCAESLTDVPTGYPGGSRFAASMETAPAVPHVTERTIVASEPRTFDRTHARNELVQCAQCR